MCACAELIHDQKWCPKSSVRFFTELFVGHANAKCRHTRGHAQNAQSSRSHAIITLHVDSWAAHGSAEDEEAAQGEQLLSILQRARALLDPGGEEVGSESVHASGEQGAAADNSLGLAEHDELGASVDGSKGLAENARAPRAGADAGQAGEEGTEAAQGGEEVATAQEHAQPERAAQTSSAVLHDAPKQAAAQSGGKATAPPAAAAAVRRMKRYGRLVLVDLAGSERLKATGSEGGAAMAETGSINRSLFTLGQVLHALSARRPGSTALVRISQGMVARISHCMAALIPVPLSF